MRVALVFPNYLQNFFIYSASFHPPLGLSMIAAVLKKAGHDVHVVDATAERLNMHRLINRIEKIQPDVIGITSNVSFGLKSYLTGKIFKKKLGVQVIFGGPWATIEYLKLLEGNAADFVVRGEGEKTIVELVECMENKGNFENIEGIAYKDGNDVKVTPDRKHIEDLDELPYPAWELFPKPKKYFWNPNGTVFYPVMTSRGCPLGCIYCTKVVHGYSIRTRSIEHVIGEIKYLRENFAMDEIMIIDDNFNWDVERAEKILDEIITLDYNLSIRFSNGLRADRLTPRLAWKLKKAGAYEIALGIESGNQEVVNKLGKKLDLDQVRRANRLLKRVGISTTGFIMIGLPFETVSSMIDTKKFLIEIDLDVAQIFKTIPFPGTKLYDLVEKKGRFVESYGKELVFYSSKKAAYEVPGMPNELIELAFQDIYRSVYLRFSKLKSLLRTLRIKNWRINLNSALLVLLNIFRNKEKTDPNELKATIIKKLKAARSS